MSALPRMFVIAASSVVGLTAAAEAQPVVEFRLRPDGGSVLSPASPTLRIVLEARMSNWGEGVIRINPDGNGPYFPPIPTPIGTGPGVPGQIGWLVAALFIETNEPALPGRTLRHGVLRAGEYSRVSYPDDASPTGNAIWQQENSESTRYGWTYALRNGIGALGEDHPTNGIPTDRDGFLILSGGVSNYHGHTTYYPVSGLNISAAAEYQGTMIGLSPSPSGIGEFVPLYAFEYSTSDFSQRAFNVDCRVARDSSGSAMAGLYFRNPVETGTSGRVYNCVFVDADPLTADVDIGSMFLQVGPTPCSTDISGNGGTDIADIFEFLGEWFAGTNLADWDHSGLVRVEDIFEYWADWYEGC